MILAPTTRSAARQLARKTDIAVGLHTKNTAESARRALNSSSNSSTFRQTSNVRKSAAVGVEEDVWDIPPPTPAPVEKCIVNSHTEWDPLEEVIVGRVDGATIPEWHVSGKAVWPAKHWDMFKKKAGQPFPSYLMQKGDDPRIMLDRELRWSCVSVLTLITRRQRSTTNFIVVSIIVWTARFGISRPLATCVVVLLLFDIDK